jgi:hypothetical protein
MWFKPVHYLLFLMTVVLFCLQLCTSLPCHCHCQCFSLHGANLGDRSTWHRRLRVFSISGECKGHSNLHGHEHRIQIYHFRSSCLLALFALFSSFFSSRSSAYDMGKELANKGKWKRKWKYRSESLFLIIFCVLFFFSVFFYFLSCFLHGTVSIYVTLWCSIYLIPRCHAYRTWVLFLTLLDRYTDFTCNGKCCLCLNLGHLLFCSVDNLLFCG